MKNAMTGLEIDNFFKCDKRLYDLENNENFLMLWNASSKIMDMKQMQTFMNDIVSFFEFKYPDILWHPTQDRKNPEFQNTLKIIKMLNKEQLYYRLHHDERLFLDCPLGRAISLKKKQHKFTELQQYLLKVESDGSIEEQEIICLKRYHFIEEKEKNIHNVYELYHTLEKEKNIDYQSLEEMLNHHKYDILTRNQFLNLTALKMLYSENTLPTYAYQRVKRFLRMFASMYDTRKIMDTIDDIASFDYTGDKKEYIKKVFWQSGTG